MDSETHQIVQIQAIGEVVSNAAFPPARTMLGNWKIYPAEKPLPPSDVVERRRKTGARAQ